MRNTAFKNVHIFGRTIAGVIAGQNSGLIENCFIDENCTAEISTHFYDESCNVGGICGLNDADDTNQCIRNVISLAKCSIADQFVGYGEEYIEGNKERLIEENKNNPDFDIDSVSQDELMRWTFYGGTKGSDKKDSNGVETNGVYGGVGISYGAVMDCYAANFAIKTAHFSAPAYFGQTHVYLNKIADGPDTGSIRNCAMKTMEELKDASLYSDFPTDAWNIYDGEIPSLSAYYSYFVR